MKWPRLPSRRGARGGAAKALGARDLLWRFTAAGVLVLGALAGLIALLARQTGTEQAMDRASEATFLIAKAVVEPHLTPEVVAGDPEALREFSQELRGFVPEGSLVRVKLWDADGRIVYSDDPRLIGEQFVLAHDEVAALNVQGATDSEISDLDGAGERVGLREAAGGLRRRREHGRAAVAVRGLLPLRRRGRRRTRGLAAVRAARARCAGPPRAGADPVRLVLARRLGRQQQERERLLRYAVESSDAERRRIAGDLHDGVIQDLTGLTFALDATRLGSSTEEDRSRVIADGATRLREQHLGAADADGRPLPAQPGHDGRWTRRCTSWPPTSSSTASPSSSTCTGSTGLTPEVTALLFRAAQESIRNVVAHSDARLVRVEARTTDGFAVLQVDDDGRGFNESTLDRRREGGHFGLRTLGDLVADSGGTLTVRSAPGAGTQVRLEAPVR